MNQQFTSDTFWDSRNIETLKALKIEGLSAAKIAERFGISRNAVLGKLHRMGLCKPNPRVFWNEERTELARKLWLEGYSSTIIMTRIGAKSRNAVLAKIERMGLANRERRTQFKVHRYSHEGHVKKKRFSPERMLREWKGIPKPQEQFRCTIIGLDNQTCRWPLWESDQSSGFYCGTPEADLVEGKPYCRWHTMVSMRQLEVSLEKLG